jgi:iron complex transport system substrate-binding protein
MNTFPTRIVCLTEETTETLYLLEQDWRIVGISGFTVRTPRARREKPKVSAFTSAKLDRIFELRPDLVLGFSDLQADIAADLVRQGLNVHIFNHRDIAGIFGMISVLGGMVGCEAKAARLVATLSENLQRIRLSAAQFTVRPRVYFEEWDEPMISGIRWVSELVGVAGGDDCFEELSRESLGRNRIIADPMEVVRRAPDIILGSWCGKKFQPKSVMARAGWEAVPAVATGQLHEIKSSLILQPGPAALTDGVNAIHAIIKAWQHQGMAVDASGAPIVK